MTVDDIIGEVIAREGGYVDHPADRGGPTKYGITMPTLALARGKDVNAADIKALGEFEARAIYRTQYFEAPGFASFKSSELQGVMVDCAVHHGPIAAIRMLQRTLRVDPDGVLGPITVAAANALGGRHLGILVLCERARFFGRLITKDPTQAAFAAGWMNRLADQIEGLA